MDNLHSISIDCTDLFPCIHGFHMHSIHEHTHTHSRGDRQWLWILKYYMCSIKGGIEGIPPYVHSWENGHHGQNIQNEIRRMSSGKDALCHHCTIKDTHKYDWRKRG